MKTVTKEECVTVASLDKLRNLAVRRFDNTAFQYFRGWWRNYVLCSLHVAAGMFESDAIASVRATPLINLCSTHQTRRAVIIVIIIIIIVKLTRSWATYWPVQITLVDKSLQWSSLVPSAFGVQFFRVVGNLLQGVLLTCCIQFPL
jgi:hypothetical protein